MAKSKLLEYLGYPLSELFKSHEFSRAVSKIITCCGSTGPDTFLSAGDNISITGTGTEDDPYVITGLAAPAWNLTGNTGTNPTTNFIGTIDAQDLAFRVGNANAGRIYVNDDRLSLGKNSAANFFSSTAIGAEAISGAYGTAIGANANANDFYATAVGQSAYAEQLGTAIGQNAIATINSTALGRLSNTNGFDTTVALGSFATNTESNQLMIGSPTFSMTITAPAYPSSRNDSGTTTPTNFLYTDSNGKFLSAPYSSSATDTAAWHRTGDSVAAGSFLGTTNAQPLIFRSNNIEAGRILTNQKFLLGTTSDPGNYRFWSEGGSLVGVAGQSSTNYAGYFSSGNTSTLPTLYVQRNNTSANMAEFYSPSTSIKLSSAGEVLANNGIFTSDAPTFGGGFVKNIIARSSNFPAFALEETTSGLNHGWGIGMQNDRALKFFPYVTSVNHDVVFGNFGITQGIRIQSNFAGSGILLNNTVTGGKEWNMFSTGTGYGAPVGSFALYGGNNGYSIVSTADGDIVFGAPSPTSSAKFEIVSTTKGFLKPVMNSTQKGAISSPVAGLEVFDTTLALPSYYDGTAWRTVLKGYTEGSSTGNTAVGDSSANGTITGFNNTSVGYQSLNILTSGSDNTAVGSQAGRSITTSGSNSLFGAGAGRLVTGQNNTGIGARALYNTTTGQSNSAFGYQSLNTNVDGQYNSAFGTLSLFSNTSGRYNTAVGDQAAFSNTTGWYNVAIGSQSLYNVTGAGQYNTGIGYQSGMNLTTGSNCIAIGLNTNLLSATTDNQMNIGNIIFGNGLTGSVSSPAGNIGIGDNNPTTRLSVSGTTKTTNFYTVSAPPTIVLGAGAGTGASFSATGTNKGGTISVTTGSTPTTNSTILTLTFSGSFSYPNGCAVTIRPKNKVATTVIADIFESGNTTSFTVTSGDLGLTASTTYQFNYIVEGF